MTLLLDTNILVPLVDGTGRDLPGHIVDAIGDEDANLSASVVSVWEVAIKHRLGKLAFSHRPASRLATSIGLNTNARGADGID